MPAFETNVGQTTSVLANEQTPRTTRSASALWTDEFLAPGTRVERYVLAERLGAGGMGVVYKAYDTQLSRHVALKFLHHAPTDLDRLARANVYRERLLREAQALAKLSHPNVVALFDVGEHQGSVFLAMEFIEGVSLSTWVRERRDRKQEVLRALIDAGRGLAAAHRAGVLHRDFKLGNVMVSAGGRVRVLDFGLARAAEGIASEERLANEHVVSPPILVSLSSELTQSGTVLGTIGYIAPESFVSSTLDERSDQFSYAESVFVALTGHHSFESHSSETYRAALLEGRRARWPRGISRRIRRVVEKGQSFDPAVVDRATGAAHEVAQLADCDDVSRLLGESDRMPDDPARRTQIEAIDTELDAIDAWMQAGRLQESLERSQRAVARAEQLEFVPVIARAHARRFARAMASGAGGAVGWVVGAVAPPPLSQPLEHEARA